jgi:hypothetical protein
VLLSTFGRGGVLHIEIKQTEKAVKQAREQALRHDEEPLPLKEGGSSQRGNKRANEEGKRSGEKRGVFIPPWAER